MYRNSYRNFRILFKWNYKIRIKNIEISTDVKIREKNFHKISIVLKSSIWNSLPTKFQDSCKEFFIEFSTENINFRTDNLESSQNSTKLKKSCKIFRIRNLEFCTGFVAEYQNSRKQFRNCHKVSNIVHLEFFSEFSS